MILSKEIKMNNDIEKILISQEQMNNRLDELAAQLNEKYTNSKELPLVVSVMTGALMFSGKMLERLNFMMNLDVVKASSYEGAHSTGKVTLSQDVKYDVKNRPVIIMEDIIDTGRTLKFLKDLFLKRGAASVEICAMMDKPKSHEVDLKGDYIGFNAPNEFLVGYGLDYDGLYRNLPYIGVLKHRVYA